VWKAYGVTRSIERSESGYYVAHSVDWIVVQNGRILGRIRGMLDPKTFASYLKRIVERKC